jgi:hypothetical protein
MNAAPAARYFAIALRPAPAAETPTLRLRREKPDALPLPRARGTTPPPTACSALDERLLAILMAPLRATETPTQCFDRKERELGNAFFELTDAEAYPLYRRLITNFACDLVARKFAGLADERKQRLLTFLENHCC